MNHLTTILCLAAIALVSAACGAGSQQAGADGTDRPYVLDHTANTIDGTEANLADYEGKVILIVNTASKCGFTPQYAGLETLYESKKDAGLVVLGFPSNDFMGQEPGTDEEIAAFCEENYGVTFPMFSKVKVKGDSAHPLFKELASATGEPTWNFNKFLIDREGKVVARFDSRKAPNDAELTAQIDALLGG